MDLLEPMVEPERMFTFRVSWEDDRGQWHTNIGYRCQFNGAGAQQRAACGSRPTCIPASSNSWALSRSSRTPLTALPIGGGKGGADFDPAGKSDAGVMRTCQAYMQALYRYIRAGWDVPAGDMGVGGRETGISSAKTGG